MRLARTFDDTSAVRAQQLLAAIGIDPASFARVHEWALCEHLVSVLVKDVANEPGLFSTPDGMRRFRGLLESRTQRRWSPHDVTALYDRVKLDSTRHFREPIPPEEYLRLVWQSPLECVRCGEGPPNAVLHVDHILPASRGGSSTRGNLQFLCQACNLAKSNKREVTDSWLDLL